MIKCIYILNRNLIKNINNQSKIEFLKLQNEIEQIKI
jgi:hypothetical protein